ncbi:uncharacterized protein CANTADRAFT_26633 [Suhomyces tanzawaensis NRRL Y-17324]|uniref:Uncharacterized protein n=1 Tax=Suhomyces tanzawaensis NRRL Y-17324 TaxID=984487 RepID=A0A1E4SGK5_9ASCO|nr:uncharacterized protein CANTADRAFT_26633 [Suhomyces tanzawaensis NRRL Y-17324]ODV78595.1 hypothetical protein CANTADRAFT_26633 [Suhomyces tanzawaensis NRRL Y-17324]
MSLLAKGWCKCTSRNNCMGERFSAPRDLHETSSIAARTGRCGLRQLIEQYAREGYVIGTTWNIRWAIQWEHSFSGTNIFMPWRAIWGRYWDDTPPDTTSVVTGQWHHSGVTRPNNSNRYRNVCLGRANASRCKYRYRSARKHTGNVHTGQLISRVRKNKHARALDNLPGSVDSQHSDCSPQTLL